MTHQPTGGAAQRLNIKGYSLDLSCLLFDVTHTASGGNTARIAGKADASGTINADFDLDLPPYAASPLIVPGVSGLCLFYVNVAQSKFFQVPTIIEKVRYESQVESYLKYSFEVKMNSLAGAFVFPAL